MPLSEQRSCLGLIEAPFVSFLVHITCQPDFFFFFFICVRGQRIHARAKGGRSILEKGGKQED